MFELLIVGAGMHEASYSVRLHRSVHVMFHLLVCSADVSGSPLPAVAIQYEEVQTTTTAVFNILAGPAVINITTPKKRSKFYNAMNDVSTATLKAEQTGMIGFVDENRLKKNILSAIRAGTSRLARELIGKLIGFHNVRGGAGTRSKRDSDDDPLKKFFRDLAEEEGISIPSYFIRTLFEDKLETLAFAIDSTGSMSEEMTTAVYISKVITASATVAASGSFEQPQHYVLAEFNDPGKISRCRRVRNSYTNSNVLHADVPDAQRFPADTEGAKEFISALEALRPHDGGDCPERTLKGILNALAEIKESGAIFVFTDASANDNHLKGEVIASARAKGTTISFFGDQDCSIAGDSTFDEIAKPLRGHRVRSISRSSSLTEMMSALLGSRDSDSGGATDGSSGKRSVSSCKAVTIPIDSTVTDMKIVVTTTSETDLSMNVHGPGTHHGNSSLGDSYGTFHVENPQAGSYRLSYCPTDSEFTVLLESTLHFEYTFWKKDASSSNVYLLNTPVKGKYCTLLL